MEQTEIITRFARQGVAPDVIAEALSLPFEIVQRQAAEVSREFNGFPSVVGLSPQQTVIAHSLAKSGRVTRGHLEAILYAGYFNGAPAAKCLDKQIHMIRKKLKPFAIVINVIFGEGWEMPPASRVAFLELALLPRVESPSLAA